MSDNRRVLLVCVVLELLCIAASGVALWQGSHIAAVGLLTLPVQLILVGWLAQLDQRLMATAALLLPFAGLELLPGVYRDALVLAGVPILLLFFRLTQRASGCTSGEDNVLDRTARIALGLLVLSLLLSALVAKLSGRPSSGILRSSFGGGLAVVTIWATGALPKCRSHVEQLLLFAAGGTTAVALLVPFLSGDGAAASKFIVTPFGKPTLNLFAFFVGPSVAFCMAWSLDEADAKRRLALIIMAVVLAAVLVYTRSRGAWVGFAAAYFYVLARRKSLKLVVLTAAFIALLLATDALRTSLQLRAEQTSAADPAIAGRLLLWRSALLVLKDHWLFGVGANGFTALKFSYSFPAFVDPTGWYNAHSFYLEVATSLGVLGAAGFVLLVSTQFTRLDRISRRRSPLDGTGPALGLAAASIHFLVHGLVESPAWHAPTLAYWALLTGLGLSIARLRARSVPSCTSAAVPVVV